MQPPVTVDPRYHDAVLFNLDGFGNQIVDGAPALDSMVELAQRLHHAGVATAAFSARHHHPLLRCNRFLNARELRRAARLPVRYVDTPAIHGRYASRPRSALKTP